MGNKKATRRLPTRLRNLAENLEYNLYFLSEIERLKNKKKITKIDLFELRKNLKEKGIAELSQYWDEFLRLKITSNLSIKDIFASCAPVKQEIDPETREAYYSIEIYPETTDDDVIESFKYIMESKGYPTKTKVQPIYNSKIYDYILRMIKSDKKSERKISAITKELRNQGFRTNYSTVREVIKRMSIGL